MSIKSDRWITRMAREHGMIEPFEPTQVRVNGNGKIVSYGVSSYGYDVRCADEFKIFTNINTTIVDPKRFDERSFVDFKGDVCIIPPNSFALARTVEYFRIPRSTLTICLGKCVTGDTRVVDADTGALVPIEEFGWGRKTLGLRDWALGPQRVAAVMPNGRKPVFELATRAGLKIRATGNHPFRKLTGWTPLEQLRPGDRIAVARRIPIFGKTRLADWEATLLGLTISAGRGRARDRFPVFASADPVLVECLRRAVDAAGFGEVVRHGRFGYRWADSRSRGGVTQQNRAARWLEHHGLDGAAGERCVPRAVFVATRESTRLFLQALFSGGGDIRTGAQGGSVEYPSRSRRLAEDVHHLLLRFGVFSSIRDEHTNVGAAAHRIRITDREQILRFGREIGFLPGSIEQARLETELLPLLSAQPARLRSRLDTLPREAWSLLSGAAASRARSFGSVGGLDVAARSVPYASSAQLAPATAHDELSALLDGPIWDVVEEIRAAGEEEVFDLAVPAVENFVANDIVVHNSTYARCGIIVNVTPLEPEWEGHVTLEFSNTTPLPAKIYANEGVAQMLFLESDEVCEVSYKDRGGKYMRQRGVTLPKA